MFIFGTAGHIDHGKTALISALTGMNTDRLPEEKERGMTIDLGFAWMDFSSGEKVGIIDVPGHKNFVKNMIVGVTGIDAVILVVDAHEGWMPQTEEHFQIIELLEIKYGVIVLTKIDIVEQDRIELVEREVREKIKNSALYNSPIVRVSSVKNIGINQLKLEIQNLIAQIKPKRDIKKPRLCIDRVFNIRGSGTIVTGTLVGGKLLVNQDIIIYPSYKKARIRSMQTYKEQSIEVSPGTRVALNLAGVKKDEMKRGDIVFGYEAIRTSRYLDVYLKLIPDFTVVNLKNGMILDFIWETKELSAQIILDKAKIDNNPDRYAQIRLKDDLPTYIGDYFILRRPTPPLTIGGGIILDPLAEKHSFYNNIYIDFLKKRKSLEIKDLILTELNKNKFHLLKEFLVNSNYSFSEISDNIQDLKDKKLLIVADVWIVDNLYWKQQSNRLIDHLNKEHQKYPLEKSFQLNLLQSKFKYLPAKLFLSLLQFLVNENKIELGDGKIYLSSHKPKVSVQKQEIISKILQLLQNNPTNPPTEKFLVERFQDGQEIIRYLIQENQVVKLDGGILMDKRDFHRMKEQIIGFLKIHKSITLEEVRNMLGMSRKYMIPFLESLDKEGITKRKDNKRYLR